MLEGRAEGLGSWALGGEEGVATCRKGLLCAMRASLLPLCVPSPQLGIPGALLGPLPGCPLANGCAWEGAPPN